MNQKTAKLIKRHCKANGIRKPMLLRKAKEWWNTLNHMERRIQRRKMLRTLPDVR